MEETNGSLRGPKAMNGINGGIKSSMNGHAITPRRRTAPKGPGFLMRSFSIVARLLTWYSIITVLFRCPATLDDCTETSPRICKPYFQLKQAVAPTLAPYYDAYAARYVELAQPYYETLDRTVITPAQSLAIKYGAPQVIKAQAYSKAQWDKNIQPQMAKYQALVKAQYDESLAPHVAGMSAALAPYIDIARTNALQTYHEILMPAYQFVLPYAQQGYMVTSAYAAETAVPAVTWAWDATYIFLDGTVWPRLRILYVETVEPQLVKIGERLGRYNDNKLVDSGSSSLSSIASSFTKPTSSVAPTSPLHSTTATLEAVVESEIETPATAGGDTIPTSQPSVEETPTAASDEQPADAGAINDAHTKVVEIVAEDLRSWQERYAKAADEGAAEIEERVEEIAKRMMRRQARTTGKSLVQALKDSADKGLEALRHEILAIVAAALSGSKTADEARADLIAAVRKVGLEIKQKAQEVRTWHEGYESELTQSVTDVAATHFKILDSIRDLALTKIGMKWAWMDGVTYREWAKYHELTDRFDEWHDDLHTLIVTHPTLEAARNAGNDIEADAMDIASAAAKELGRLKQVGQWKLAAGDASDDFDSESRRAAAEAAAAAEATTETAAEAAKEAVEPASDAASKVASSVFEPIDEATSVASQASEEASEAAATGSSVINEASSVAASFVESSITDPSATTEGADGLASEASPILLVETPIIAGNTSELTEADGETPVELPVGEELEEPEITVPTATTSVKSAFMGAAAQSVPSRKPILDDDASDPIEYIRSDLPESISVAARSAYSAAMSHAAEQYSHALSIVSAQIKGTPKPVHEQMLASVTSAYSQAMESASSRLGDVVKSAQDRFAATPTKNVLPSIPTFEWSRIESIAAERLQEGRAWAEEQYEAAKIAIGLATPTPSTPSEHVQRLMENARHNYYAGLGVAHARYSEFIAAASSALSSLTATPTPTDLSGTVSSIASVASESAASAASVASENVSSVASVVGESVSSAAQAGYDNLSAAHAAALEKWDGLVSQLSTQVYGAPTPTPWYQSVYSAAGEFAASATGAAADGAGSVTKAASSYASTASEQAASQYAAVSSIVSELLLGKEPSFSESVYSRLSLAYATGLKSAESLASAVSETVVGAASQATDSVKEAVGRGKDEL